jgi:hypothetical protein
MTHSNDVNLHRGSRLKSEKGSFLGYIQFQSSDVGVDEQVYLDKLFIGIVTMMKLSNLQNRAGPSSFWLSAELLPAEFSTYLLVSSFSPFHRQDRMLGG